MNRIFILMTISLLGCAVSSPKLTQKNYEGLGRDSVSAKDISEFTPHSANPEIMHKVQLGMDIRSPGMGYVTEDGKSMYIDWNVTGSSQVWKLDAPMAFPIQLTGGEDRTSLLGEIQNGKLLLSRDIGGEENPGIYMMNKDGGEILELYKKKKVQARVQYIAVDGSFFIFSANDREPGRYTFYKFDIASKQYDSIFDEKGIWAISDVWIDEKTMIFSKILGNTASEHYLYSTDTKKLLPLIGVGEQNDFTVNFASSTQDYIVNTNKLSNFHRLYHFKNNKLNPISPEINYDIESFSIDRHRNRIIYSVNQDGYTKQLALKITNFKPLELPKFPQDAEHVFVGHTTNNSRFTSFAVGFHNHPRQSYVYDWQTKKLVSWTRASTPEINTASFIKAKLEYYPSRDGTKIPYFVRIPTSCENKKCPVIVDFHGGPEGQSLPGFSPYFENFLNEGYIFVQPNVRGSSGYGKLWLDSDNGAKRLNVITDIEDAGLFLKQKYGALKIGVMGGSYGGYSTLYAMTKFAGTFDAGVANVGMSNLVTFLKNTAPYRRPLRISEYGDPEKDLAALIELSPVTHIAKLKSPLMIVQGVNDPRVPVGEAMQFKQVADQKGIPVELILFADEGHGASKRSNQAMQTAKTIEFFNKYLKP